MKKYIKRYISWINKKGKDEEISYIIILWFSLLASF